VGAIFSIMWYKVLLGTVVATGLLIFNTQGEVKEQCGDWWMLRVVDFRFYLQTESAGGV
jgi:hypothetical protein